MKLFAQIILAVLLSIQLCHTDDHASAPPQSGVDTADPAFQQLLALVVELSNRFEVLENGLKSVKTKTEEMESKIDDMTTKKALKSANNYVGFTAYNSADQYLDHNERAVFNTAPTNFPAGSLDTATGVYTCPVTGLYFFATSVYSTDSHVNLRLLKDNEGVMTSFADFEHADQGANFWIVECIAGQEVWVSQSNPDGGNLRVGRDGGIMHSFVGFLITL